MQWLVLALMVLAGLLGWRLLAPHLRRLQAEDTTLNGAWLWLAGFLMQIAVVSLLMPEAPPGELPLVRAVTLQALAGVLAVGVMLMLIGWRERSLRGLGLRPQRGPPALLVALSGWLLFLPCFQLVAVLNAQLLAWFEVTDGRQHLLRAFLEQPAARSSMLTWSAMVVVMPICEEIFFRGALFGGLRRVLTPAAAIAVSALMFGLAHEPLALLPTAVLGAFLAWLYERTGSLSAPILFHGLHNGITLLVASRYPELLR